MNTAVLEGTANALVANGKGILAADETPETLTKRFGALQIDSTSDSRRMYREMFFTAPGAADFISGVIMQDETIRQKDSAGTPLAALLTQMGMIPGVKVDAGVKRLARRPGEGVTEGLHGLRERLREYGEMGARFAKWRAVIHIADGLPSWNCIRVNADALARYAALCQEQNIVPIVEPQVLMDGTHTIQRCEEITGNVLRTTINALVGQRVILEGMLLKPNMIVPAIQCARQSSLQEVALVTLRCLRRHVPAAIPGIVFLSGGQHHLTATLHLNAINRLHGPKPWKLSFSFGRALQDEALRLWQGKDDRVRPAQRVFYQRARCVSAAAQGNYASTMEAEMAA